MVRRYFIERAIQRTTLDLHSRKIIQDITIGAGGSTAKDFTGNIPGGPRDIITYVYFCKNGTKAPAAALKIGPVGVDAHDNTGPVGVWYES